MHASLLLAIALAAPSVEEFIDGSEIGNEAHYVAFDSAGKFRSEMIEKAGKTHLTGSWALEGDTATVKATGCTGPSCKDLKKDFTAKVEVTADRAMVVQSTAPGELLRSGSYYCRMGGCEKRIGVVLVGKDAKARTLNYLLDHLIDQNRKRDMTVVWTGPRLTVDAGKTRIEYCTREKDSALKGAQFVAGDLAALKWMGERLQPAASPDKDCLWDVRVVVADDVAVPAKQRP